MTHKKDGLQMSKFKDFGSGPDLSNVEAVTFQLHGETFTCVKAVQGKVLLSLVKDAADSDPAVAAGIIEEFFSKVLVEESLVRFNELLVDKDRIVSVETLGEITGWIVEQLTDRPEEQPGV
jgi:hypothetical protein